MHRRCLTAAVAVVVALAPLSSAKGGPEQSPFAGTYSWDSAPFQIGSWAVTISDGGQIAGSLVSSGWYTKGSISGRVKADGSYAFTRSLTGPTFDDGERGHSGGPKSVTERTEFAGKLAPDANGNLVGTDDTYVSQSFTWLRQ